MTILRLIWLQTEFRLVPIQSENDKYNLILVWFNKIQQRFLLSLGKPIPDIFFVSIIWSFFFLGISGLMFCRWCHLYPSGQKIGFYSLVWKYFSDCISSIYFL